MSTKTTFKRIALVAVVALGLGGFATVPANAAQDAVAGTISAVNTKSATANTLTVGASQAVYFGATATIAELDSGEFLTFTAALTNYPAGGYVAVAGAGSAATLSWAGAGVIDTASGSVVTLEMGGNGSGTTTAVTATGTDGLGKFTFTPTKAGVHEVTVWNDANDDGIINLTEARQTISLTVAAASGYSAPLSTVVSGTGATAATAATDLLPIAASKTTGTQAANIRVAIKDTSGTAYTGQTVTASIAGPGLLGAAQTNASATTADTTSGTVRATSVTDTNGFVSVTVWPDGTSGTGVVTISVTDQVTGATSVLGTESVVFYGSVAKLTVDTTNYTILKAAGGVTGGSVAGSTATDYLELANRVNDTDIPAVVIKATDSSGNPVGGLTIKGLSSDVTVANSWTVAGADATNGCQEDILSAANEYSSGGTGYYNCALSTPTSAVSGGKATITFRILDPADPLGVAYLTTTVDVTVGGTKIATETLSFDKASYSPGEAMVITRTAKDSSGNAVADGTAAPAVTFSKAVGGTAPAASTYVGGKKVTSTTAPSVFAPVIGGEFLARMTSGNAAATVVTATATVSDEAASAATDAANEATDAANAATDAALAAADAADAATAAAQDASDAVAALSASVSKMISSLKAQITSLTNLVIKIQKKVRA